MALRIAQWVAGGLTLTSSVLTIVAAVRRAPLRVLGDVEVHPTGWAIAGAIFASVLAALLVEPLLRAPRRARVERFKELRRMAREVRSELLFRPRDPVAPIRQVDLHARLQPLGVELSLKPEDLTILIEFMERGALREAKKRFPVGR